MRSQFLSFQVIAIAVRRFFFFVFLDAFRLAVAVAAIAAQEKDGEC